MVMAKVNGKYLNDIAGDLPEDLHMEYLMVKESYKAHRVLTEAFETKLRDHFDCPELKAWYRYGQLSVSIGEPKAVKVSKPKVSLSDWLEQQQR
jgi:hypothetical protein